jgi:hypothetical protein
MNLGMEEFLCLEIACCIVKLQFGYILAVQVAAESSEYCSCVVVMLEIRF